MVGSKFKISKISLIIVKTNALLDEIKKEEVKSLNGQSIWSLSLLQDVVYPEIKEINDYALKGKIFFKYGPRQRMLESTYMMLDTFDGIGKTTLGKHIFEFQKIIDSV